MLNSTDLLLADLSMLVLFSLLFFSLLDVVFVFLAVLCDELDLGLG